MTSDSLPRAADADYLTGALRRSGALRDGRLRLTYDAAEPGAPSTVIVKTGHPAHAGGWLGARHEVAFYEHVASGCRCRSCPSASTQSTTRRRKTGTSCSRT